MTNCPDSQVSHSILCEGWSIVFSSAAVSVNSSVMCKNLVSEFEVIAT